MGRVLEITNPRKLRKLSHRDFPGEIAEDVFDHVFRLADALWLHNGDPAMPHAELTGGKCSDGFVDTLRVLKYTNLCEVFAWKLVHAFTIDRCNLYFPPESRFTVEDASALPFIHPDWVIGSDHAGATFSFAVALELGAKHDFTEKLEIKDPETGEIVGKKQLWKRHIIEPEELVLQVEELVTTTGTLQAVREGIREGNPNPVTFVPVVLTLVHRSDVYEFEGAPILYLRHYDIESWEPEECPLCAAGSKRIRPKQNWAELTGKERG